MSRDYYFADIMNTRKLTNNREESKTFRQESKEIIFVLLLNVSHVEKCCRACDKNSSCLLFSCVSCMGGESGEGKATKPDYVRERWLSFLAFLLPSGSFEGMKCWLTTKRTFSKRTVCRIRSNSEFRRDRRARRAPSNSNNLHSCFHLSAIGCSTADEFSY